MTDTEPDPTPFEKQDPELGELMREFMFYMTRREQTSKAKQTARLHAKQAGRNEPCPCGSGKKFKKCCL